MYVYMLKKKIKVPSQFINFFNHFNLITLKYHFFR